MKATLYDYIEKAVEATPNLSDENIARKVLKEIGVATPQAMILLSAVASVVESWRRAPVRAIERKVFRRNGGEAIDVAACRVDLADETFALGDGRRVSWGEATIEEHRERATLLRKHLDGVHRTLEAHLVAIAAIEEAGVKCLNEIPEAA